MLGGTSWPRSEAVRRAKRWLVDVLFGLAGPILEGSERYRQWQRRRRVSPPSPVAGAPVAGDPAAQLSGLRLGTSDGPQLSILITSYGNLAHVAACLRSIADHPPDTEFEVIVADDASGVPAMDQLAGVAGLRFLPNETNLGYLRTVNRASRSARGEFLWLLNDDTLVTAGAANALLDALRRVPGCVAAGSRLLNTDGTVQEAGSIVWRDGRAASIGAGSDRSDATTRYMHDVDYCSAASIMLRTADFSAAGGYDDVFSPAYYEDTDLAFKLRAQGGRVVLQPASEVVHIGGGSYGSTASRQLLRANRIRFLAKWGTELAGHCIAGDESFAPRDRAAKRGAVLVLSAARPDYAMLERLAAAFVVKLWIDDRTAATGLVDQWGAAGIEIISANTEERLGRWLKQHHAALDFAVAIGEAAHSPGYGAVIKRYARAEFRPDGEQNGLRIAQLARTDADKQQRLTAALSDAATNLPPGP